MDEDAKAITRAQSDTVIMGEVQMILAEKRTSMAAMRTGIAVFALPLSVFSFLIAMSGHYEYQVVLPFLIPVYVINGALAVLGTYLIIRAVIRLRRYDRMIVDLKRKHGILRDIVD